MELHFGEPIAVIDSLDEYRSDPAHAVRNLTDLVAHRLAAVTVNHPTPEEERVVDRVAALALADDPGPDDGHRFARRNALRRELAAAIQAGGGTSGTEFRTLAEALAAHEADLRRIGVDPEGAAPLEAVPPGRSTDDARLALSAIPAAFGLLANGPVLAGVWVASRGVRHETWRATTKGVVGTVLCPIVWTSEVACLSRRLGTPCAFVLTAAGASAGIATLSWWDRFDDRRRRPRSRVAGDRDRALDDARASRQKVRDLVAGVAARIPAPVD